MLAHRYHVWDWGNRISKPSDDCEKYQVGAVTIAKRDTTSQYEIFNELVAMHLGRCIGLPIPVGIVLEKASKPYYASFKVGIIGVAELPDGDIDSAIARLPAMCCGAIVFDAWISNVDRHSKNFWFDEEEGKLFLFDHGCALLNRIGVDHLTSTENSLAINSDNNDFMPEIRSLEAIDEWIERIAAIPSEAIHETVREAATAGVSTEEATQCGTWLVRRRKRLKELFRSGLSDFTKYSPGMFDPFREPNDDEPEYYI
jgi:hypothetical protein